MESSVHIISYLKPVTSRSLWWLTDINANKRTSICNHSSHFHFYSLIRFKGWVYESIRYSFPCIIVKFYCRSDKGSNHLGLWEIVMCILNSFLSFDRLNNSFITKKNPEPQKQVPSKQYFLTLVSVKVWMSEIKWCVISSLHVCDNHRCPITYCEQLSLYCPLQARFENSCCLIPGLFCSSENPLLLKSRRSHAAHEPLSKDFILCCLQWKVLMSQDSDSCVRIGHYVWSPQADPCPSTSLQTVRWKKSLLICCSCLLWDYCRHSLDQHHYIQLCMGKITTILLIKYREETQKYCLAPGVIKKSFYLCWSQVYVQSSLTSNFLSPLVSLSTISPQFVFFLLHPFSFYHVNLSINE